MTDKIDVLAVIDAQIAITARPHEAGLFDARAAVVELIEASQVAAALMHAMIDALDDDEFGEGDGKVLDRLNVALARIGVAT